MGPRGQIRAMCGLYRGYLGIILGLWRSNWKLLLTLRNNKALKPKHGGVIAGSPAQYTWVILG